MLMTLFWTRCSLGGRTSISEELEFIETYIARVDYLGACDIYGPEQGGPWQGPTLFLLFIVFGDSAYYFGRPGAYVGFQGL